MAVYMFPGQGSQQRGMGEGLFERYREYTRKADEVLGYSIEELCLKDPHQRLGQTQYTQCALYVVNVLTYLRRIEETGKYPAYVIGHSLGEYDALFAAGAFDFETGLRLVRKRGELMSQMTEGGMAAIIGLSEGRVNEVLRSAGLTGLDVANLNSPAQVVISGPRADIERAQPAFEAAGARRYLPLRVSGAFHSRYMAPARDVFARFLEGFSLSELRLPVISNVHARAYAPGEVRANLVEQIVRPVRWMESISWLLERGEDTFEEIGPGNVLAGLVMQLKQVR